MAVLVHLLFKASSNYRLDFGLDGEQTGQMETTEEIEDCGASDKLHKSDGDLRTSVQYVRLKHVLATVTFSQFGHVSRKKLSPKYTVT